MKNERKEELKDEMKNRISMALKDPILQQGFEIICKENTELKLKLEALEGQTPWKDIKDKSEVIGKLTKAIDLLKRCYNNYIYLEPLRSKIKQCFAKVLVCKDIKKKSR